jgi:hypothetical protein
MVIQPDSVADNPFFSSGGGSRCVALMMSILVKPAPSFLFSDGQDSRSNPHEREVAITPI